MTSSRQLGLHNRLPQKLWIKWWVLITTWSNEVPINSLLSNHQLFLPFWFTHFSSLNAKCLLWVHVLEHLVPSYKFYKSAELLGGRASLEGLNHWERWDLVGRPHFFFILCPLTQLTTSSDLTQSFCQALPATKDCIPLQPGAKTNPCFLKVFQVNMETVLSFQFFERVWKDLVFFNPR